MAYSLPTFNLNVDIYSVVAGLKAYRLTSVCNLAMGKRVSQVLSGGMESSSGYGITPQLLLPALTDIRDVFCGVEPDVVECPAGSGRWYGVTLVDDIGKGFPNEHRVATLAKVAVYFEVGVDVPNWPIPIP